MRQRISPKPRDGLIIAFAVPVLIMIIIFIQRGIFPFGDQTFLRSDMYHQYAPFFSEFQYKLRNGGSLLYSWDIGLGVNFSALYAYYLASPLNWLIIFWPKDYVIEFMTLMIVIKTGLAGLSFAWYLNRKFHANLAGIGFFGIFYAMSGYMAAYSWNIMWLDCIVLFPLVMLGVEQLVNRGRSLLYCVTLAVCILSNYYISIMICLFLVIYFVALLILKKPGRPRRYVAAAARFATYSLLAGGLAAIILLPELIALQATASGSFTFPQTVTTYFSIFDMIARHIGNIESEVGLDHWPNIYCGVAVLMFFLLYIATKKVSLKEKCVYCGLLFIMLAGFSINVLNFIWHGLHYPNSLPARQSFIYIFLMLVVCFRAYQYLREMPPKYLAIAFIGAVVFVLLAEELVTAEHFHWYVYYIAIIFLAIYAGLILLWRSGRTGLAMVLAITAVSIEAGLNMTLTSVTTTSREAYVRDNADVAVLLDSVSGNEDFYRVEKVTRKTKNDGAWMHFPSVSLFSSVANADLSSFFRQIGCEASTNAYSITGSTPLVDSLFGVEYALYSEPVSNTDILMYLRESGDTYLYRNIYALPLGFIVPSDLDECWQYYLSNPADVQNDLCLLLGADDALIPEEVMTAGDTLTFTASETGDYYVFVKNSKIKKVRAVLPSGAKTFDNVDRGYFLELGTIAAGTQVTLTVQESSESMNASVYRFNDDALIQVYDILNGSGLHLTSWKDTSLAGTIDVGDAGTLFLSIPYDAGWTVKVDGEKVETKKLFDAFLSVNLTEGTHEITMDYMPQGFTAGAWITIGSLAVFIILQLLKKRADERAAAERRKKIMGGADQ